MKKLLIVLIILGGWLIGHTQIKISEMPTYIGNPSGGYVPIVISGTNRKIDAVNFGYNKLDNVVRKIGTDSLFVVVNGLQTFVTRMDTIPGVANLQTVTTAGDSTSNRIVSSNKINVTSNTGQITLQGASNGGILSMNFATTHPVLSFTNSGLSASGLRADNANGVTWQLPNASGTIALGGTGSSLWSLTGNAGTVPGINFIGTTDGVGLRFKINNTLAGQLDPFMHNTSFGDSSLINNTGSYNTAMGYVSLWLNTTGVNNTGIGFAALRNNTTGSHSSAFGYAALSANTSGSRNTAFGDSALYAATTIDKSIGLGYRAGGATPLTNTLYISDSTPHMVYKLDSAAGAAPSLVGKDGAGNWHVYAPAGSGTVTSIATAAPMTGGTITGAGTIGINQAATSADGYVSSTDWNAFNGKQAAISVTPPIILSGASVGMVNQGTATTVLHGNASGNPAFSGVVSNDISGRIDSSKLFIQTLNLQYPLVSNTTNDTVKISQTWKDSSNVIVTNTGTTGVATINQSTKTLNIPDYSTPLNYAHDVYALIGGTIVAEPIGGNLSNISTAAALVDQTICYTIVYLPQARTVTGVKWFQNTAGSYTANNYNGVALYSLSGGTATLIDQSTNDAAIWTATSSTIGSKALAATHALSPGVYVVAFLYCRSAETTAPAIGGLTSLASSALSASDFANSVKLNGTLATQTTIPSSKAFSLISQTSTQRYAALY